MCVFCFFFWGGIEIFKVRFTCNGCEYIVADSPKWESQCKEILAMKQCCIALWVLDRSIPWRRLIIPAPCQTGERLKHTSEVNPAQEMAKAHQANLSGGNIITAGRGRINTGIEELIRADVLRFLLHRDAGFDYIVSEH